MSRDHSKNQINCYFYQLSGAYEEKQAVLCSSQNGGYVSLVCAPNHVMTIQSTQAAYSDVCPHFTWVDLYYPNIDAGCQESGQLDSRV